MFASLCLRYGDFVYPIGSQWYLFFLSTLLVYPIFSIYGLYSNIFRQSGIKTLPIIFYANAIYCITFFVSVILLQYYLSLNNNSFFGSIPRSIGIIHPIIFYVLIITNRFFIAYTYQYLIKNKNISKRTIIYGAGENGVQLLSLVEKNTSVVGFIDDDESKHNKIINGIKVYNFEDLDTLIDKGKATEIIVAINKITSVERTEILSKLSSKPVRVRFMPNVFDFVNDATSILALQDIKIEDLVERDILINNLQTSKILGKGILITGAGGSIGSELSRQIMALNPKFVLLVDHSEINLYNIFKEVSEIKIKKNLDIIIEPILLNIKNEDRIKKIFCSYDINFLFHAAAYKHVDLVENNITEAIENNIKGTMVISDLAKEFEIDNFVLVSTDKAVRPTTAMGATKRLSELYIQGLSRNQSIKTKYSIVRFGNVLNSSGSVVPLFHKQILNGGPITVTDPEVSRYFMTIPEAVRLVLESSFSAIGGEVFVLDMGKPIKIIDLARKMIRLSGLVEKSEKTPFGDIEIKIIGLKKEEKLTEELLIDSDMIKTSSKYIFIEKEKEFDFNNLRSQIDDLFHENRQNNSVTSRDKLFKIMSNYE
tara:strand:- start:12059 stop:13846 length:1788 start_codon:yes stop_codon:yes gene_type:complete